MLRMIGAFVRPLLALLIQTFPAMLPSWLELGEEDVQLMTHVDLTAELLAYVNEHIVEFFVEAYDNSEPHYHRIMTSQFIA